MVNPFSGAEIIDFSINPYINLHKKNQLISIYTYSLILNCVKWKNRAGEAFRFFPERQDGTLFFICL
jgi:hypothetical protein